MSAGLRLRALAALLVLLVSLGGMAELHPDVDAHHHHPLAEPHSAGGEHLHAVHSHPGQPLHVESSATRVHSPCRLCLYRVASAADPEPTPCRFLAPEPSGTVCAERPAALGRSHLHLLPPRGPPHLRSRTSVLA